MARTNVKTKAEPIYTAEGARAVRITPELQLRRMVLSTMLWEDNYYIDGKTIATVIQETVPKVSPGKVADLALEAREKQKLRHIPLLLCRELARVKELTAATLAGVIQRPDEMTEFLSLYWQDKKTPLAAQVKKGLAMAFGKFDAYALSKWNQDAKIKLRDVLFLCHAKPKSPEQAALWKSLVDKTIAAPDTWEVKLSAGEGVKTEGQKKDVWESLLREHKLGALALLRNLRNMQQASVSEDMIREALLHVKVDRVLPFRFISAAKHNPRLEDAVQDAMFKCVASQDKLPGKTILIVDTSGSMYRGGNVSAKSELTRVDAAAALAILIREICEKPVIYCTAGNDSARKHATALVPNRRGFALGSVISNNEMQNNIGGGGIFLKQVMDYVFEKEKTAERIVVITDEQDCDLDAEKAPEKANAFGRNNYLINIAAHKNGVGYGKWVHIDGWSEACVDFIRESERVDAQN